MGGKVVKKTAAKRSPRDTTQRNIQALNQLTLKLVKANNIHTTRLDRLEDLIHDVYDRLKVLEGPQSLF